MHSLVQAIGALRAPIVVVLLFAAGILLPGQSREIFWAMREAQGLAFAGELLHASVLLLLFIATVLGACLLLLNHPPEHRAPAISLHRRLLETIAVSCALIPLLAIVLLNIDTSIVVSDGAASVVYQREFRGFKLDNLVRAAIAGVALLMLCAVSLSDRLREAMLAPLTNRLTALAELGPVKAGARIAALIAAIVAAVVFAPIWTARALGPAGLIFVFFAVLTAAASLMTYVYDRKGVPLLSGMALAAVVFAGLGINNNHGIRRLGAEPMASRDPSAAFASWLEARKDRTRFKDREYPVYVVAAEGGGLYAGAHAASVLAHLQDACPAFAHHLFAVSGVSGGSLGAAVFASLLKADPPPPPTDQTKPCSVEKAKPRALTPSVAAYFESDLLTPLLAATLFPDFVQRILPFRVSRFDRARSLEAAFEDGWRTVMAREGRPQLGEAFAQSQRSMWSADGNSPALLLNATSVHDGDRVVAAPFPLRDATGFVDQRIDLLNRNSAVRLSTAVGISARFPIVTPAGWRKEGGEKHMLVDGGYYENSGIATAVHLIDGIARKAGGGAASAGSKSCAAGNVVSLAAGNAGQVTVCFKLIVIRLPYEAPERRLLGEVQAPLAAFYNVRYGHGRASTRRALNAYCGGQRCGTGGAAVDPHIYYRYLGAKGAPLGWYFSRRTMQRVMQPPQGEETCIADAKSEDGVGGEELAVENACLLKRVRNDLT